jgi:hypothetical protein
MQRALHNACSIATQLGDLVATANAKIAPRTMDQSEILVLLNRAKSGLVLRCAQHCAANWHRKSKWRSLLVQFARRIAPRQPLQ